jgi:hypothetical protein
VAIGSVPSLIVGVGAGAAASAAFEPALERPKQDAWLAAPNRLPDIGLIAALVAGGKVSKADGLNMAARLGFDQGPFESLTWLAQNRLDFPLMLRMWRRFGAFDSGADSTLGTLLDETLAHEQLDWQYQPWLRALKHAEIVGLGDIAYGVVRGILPAPAWVPVAPPTTGDKVPRFPQVDIDPLVLANALGFDEDMLKLMVGRSGLSMAPGLAAQALFRNIIGDRDYLLAIAEGDLRTEWADSLREVSRAIPTPHDFVQLHLRGWDDAAAMHNGAARHGMTQADTDVLYKIGRRPLNVHAITTALARGGTYNPQPGEIQDPYDAAVHQADLGPEWYDLAKANKYSYPSAFVLRSLAQSGDLGGQQAVEQVLLEIGWKPSFAQQVSTAWTSGSAGTTASDPHVSKAQTQVWTATHKAYVDSLISDATATASLGVAGVAAAAIPTVLAAWQAERDLIRASLSAAQIKKAWFEQIPDPALGRPWTEAEAVTRLEALGYTADDARILLAE